MRILHTADWHLGRTLHGASLLEEQQYLLARFVDLVREERPDLVLVAGDVYDRSVPSAEAVEVLDEVLCRLALDLRVPTVVIAGNHDSPERLAFGSRLLRASGLHLAGDPGQAFAPIVLDDADGPVQVHAVPYLDPAVVRARLGRQDLHGFQEVTEAVLDEVRVKIPAGRRSVLVAHGFVTGMAQSESERPLSVGGMDGVDASVFQGFDYVALGHLHRPQRVSRAVHYAGSLMRYSFQEGDDNKAVLAVDLGPTGVREVRSIPLVPRHQVRVVQGLLQEVLEAAASDPARQDYLAVVLLDQTPVFDAIGRLRAVYPNVLHIERPQMQVAGRAPGAAVDHRRLTDLDLFAAFFREVSEKDLDPDQRRHLEAVLEGLLRDDREGGRP